MQISCLKKDDIEEVIALLATGEPYVIPHHDYVYWIMQEYFPSNNYVVLEENKIIGFLCTLPSFDRKCYFIWQIIVDPKCRGKKIASFMVNHIIEEAKSKGINKIELSINCDNMASLKLFEKIAMEHESSLIKIGEYTYHDMVDKVYAIEF